MDVFICVWNKEEKGGEKIYDAKESYYMNTGIAFLNVQSINCKRNYSNTRETRNSQSYRNQRTQNFDFVAVYLKIYWTGEIKKVIANLLSYTCNMSQIFRKFHE